MPTYEYECLKCGRFFDTFQKMTEKPLKRCPQCKGNVKRRIGAGAGVLFKGSGFYTTDYRSEGYKKAAKADEPVSKTDKQASKVDHQARKTNKQTPPKNP